LDFGRLGVQQGSEGLEFGGKMVGCGFHGWDSAIEHSAKEVFLI